MSMNIEKFKLLEKIKKSYLKHRGDVIKVAEELNLPLDYIRRQVKKLEKADNDAVSVVIADNLTEYILLGYRSRVEYLTSMLEKLDNRDQVLVSVCCGEIVEEESDGYKCLKCGKICRVKVADRKMVFELKSKILEQLREEDRVLVEFAEKMGYTFQRPKEEHKHIHYEVKIENVNGETVRKLQELDPMERERVIKELERKLRSEIEEEENHETETMD